MKSRLHFLVVGVDGALAVGLGAFGAHALKEQLQAAGMLDVWHTAVLYQFIHTVALLSLLAIAPRLQRRARRVVAGCWIAGTLCFSGSLYWLALGGPKWLGPVTPLGGLLFIAGWLTLCTLKWRDE